LTPSPHVDRRDTLDSPVMAALSRLCGTSELRVRAACHAGLSSVLIVTPTQLHVLITRRDSEIRYMLSASHWST